MATAYTVPIKSTLARHLTVRVVVMRIDGDVLSAEDLTSASELYPPPKGKRAEGQARGKASQRRAKASGEGRRPRSAQRRSALSNIGDHYRSVAGLMALHGHPVQRAATVLGAVPKTSIGQLRRSV